MCVFKNKKTEIEGATFYVWSSIRRHSKYQDESMPCSLLPASLRKSSLLGKLPFPLCSLPHSTEEEWIGKGSGLDYPKLSGIPLEIWIWTK